MRRLPLALALLGVVGATLSIAVPGEELVVHTASVHLPVVETDKFKVKGSLAGLSLAGVGGVYFELGSINGSIAIGGFRVVEDKYIFEDAQGPIAKLVLDPATERFTATGRELFLNDLANPVPLRLVVGAAEFCTMLLFDERDGRWRFHESEDPQLLCGLPEAPLAAPAGVLVDTPTEVKVTISVPADSGVDPASLKLAEVDSGLVPVGGPLCLPVDDGEETSGDDAAGDGVYTCLVEMNEGTVRTLRLAVQGLAGGLGVVSPVLLLEVLAPPTQPQIEANLAAADAAVDVWDETLARIGDAAAAAPVAAASIAALEGVAAAGLVYDGSSIWIEFETGVEGTIPVDPFMLGEPESGAGSSDASATARDAPRLRSWAAEPTAPRAAVQNWHPDWIGNASVLEIDLESPEHLPPTVFAAIFGASDCQQFIVSRVGFPDDSDAIERFREHLESGYSTLLIDGHGSLSRRGEVQLWLNAPVTAPSVETHLLDLRTGGLGISWQKSRRRWIYAVRPIFILTLSRSFDRALVVVDADYSAANSTMADAFGRKGARAYLGFDRAVGLFFRFAVMDQFLTHMTERDVWGYSKTVSQAVSAVDPLIDPEPPHTRFVGWGSPDLAYHCPDLSFDAVNISISTINTYRTEWWDGTVSEKTESGHVLFGEWGGEVVGRRFTVHLPEAYVRIDLNDNAETILSLQASDALDLGTSYHASAARAHGIPLADIDARGFRTFRVSGPLACERLEELEDLQQDRWMIQTIVPPPSAPNKAALCDENSEIEVRLYRRD